MKILRMIARLNIGGPARHVVWLTKEFQDDEFQTTLVVGTVPEGEGDMGYFAAENNVEPVFIPEMSRELSLGDIFSLYKAYRLLKREQPDVIHTHTAKAGVIGRGAGFLYRWLTPKTLLGKPQRVKIIHTFHGHIFHSYYGGLKTKIFLLIEKMLARFATDKIVVITGQQFAEIHDKFGVGKRKQFELIPLGIDLEKLEDAGDGRAALRQELGAGADEIVVGFVGRLTAIKNVGLLLEAARLYHACDKSDTLPRLKFVIIGDGELRGQLESEAADLGPLVTFLGNRNDPHVFYAGLDIVALTSHNEGTPLSLIEAMACAKPFVATAVGGVIDLAGPVTDESHGFTVCERGLLVPPGSANELLDGIIYLAQDSGLRQAIAAEGRDFAHSHFSKARLFNDIRALYRRLV
jgi:glycosyltransferase involved in cell wall biosynthesis